MRDFSHLSAFPHDVGEVRQTSILARHNLRINRVSNMAAGVSDEDEQPVCSHSDAHLIAVSPEGKNNPVMALTSISDGMDADRAIRLLSGSPRTLSQFTIRKMESLCPGWELMDAESQNLEAFSSSLTSNDANGYQSSIKAAGKALEEYVEPLTESDFLAIARLQ